MPSHALPFALLALLVAVPAGAAPGGPLGTLPMGRYQCETGGDALGPAGIHQPGRDFRIVRASSYETPAGQGVYLLTGDRVTITSGPFRGQRFRHIRTGFLREIGPAGEDTDLRCVRRYGNAR